VYLENPADDVAVGEHVEVILAPLAKMASRVLKDSQVFTLRKDAGAVAGLRWWMPRIFRATNRIPPGCAESRTKPFVAERCSTWSRASERSPMNWPTTSLPEEVQPILSRRCQKVTLKSFLYVPRGEPQFHRPHR
jgi:hypothetical protein